MHRNPFNYFTIMGLTCCFLFAGCNALANPQGVPVPDVSELLECNAGQVHVRAITANGEFPIIRDCSHDPAEGKCSDYGYKLTSHRRIALAYLAISADQELFTTIPVAHEFPPGHTDFSKFLRFSKHEYFVRFNPNAKEVDLHVFIKGNSAPRISTILVKVGFHSNACLIAGPGIPSDPFQPVSLEETAVVAGGNCEVTKLFDGVGRLMDVVLNNPSLECQRSMPNVVLVNGEALKNNTSENGITFGSGTCTCYGPPVPRTPICIGSTCPQ